MNPIKPGSVYQHYKGSLYHIVLTAVSGSDDKTVIVYSDKPLILSSDPLLQKSIRLIAKNAEFRGDSNCYPDTEYFAVFKLRDRWMAIKTFLVSDRNLWQQSEQKIWLRSEENFRSKNSTGCDRFLLVKESSPV